MLRSAAALTFAVFAVSGCGGEPQVTRPASAVWCPASPADAASPGAGAEDMRRLLGLTEPRARQVAGRAGCSMRVVRVDGDDRPVTLDFSSHRVNVWVDDGVVVRVDGVG